MHRQIMVKSHGQKSDYEPHSGGGGMLVPQGHYVRPLSIPG